MLLIRREECLNGKRNKIDEIIEKTLEIFNTPVKRDLRRRLILSTLKMLEEQGFVLVAGNFRFPKERTQWFGDGLFVRKKLIK